MSYFVVGKENVNYTSKKTGNPVVGFKLYCTSPIGNNGVGERAEMFYCSPLVVADVLVGDKVDIFFNRYGNVTEVRKIY